MKPLSTDLLADLREERRRVGLGAGLDQRDLDALTEAWAPRVDPAVQETREHFAVVGPGGDPIGPTGPRWIFHLLGLCHRASHIGLTTPSNLVMVQRRAPTKRDWPDAWDMAAAGHIPLGPDGVSMGFLEGALKEVEEELGLPEDRLGELLVEGALQPVGDPYFSFEMDERRNPPFFNAESRQLYAATLNAAGLAYLAPDYEELSGVYLCPPEEAWDLLTRPNVASGLRFSLPRFLDWVVRKPDAAGRSTAP